MGWHPQVLLLQQLSSSCFPSSFLFQWRNAIVTACDLAWKLSHHTSEVCMQNTQHRSQPAARSVHKGPSTLPNPLVPVQNHPAAAEAKVRYGFQLALWVTPGQYAEFWDQILHYKSTKFLQIGLKSVWLKAGQSFSSGWWARMTYIFFCHY